MRVLMTGGAGYVGSACYRFFRRRGIEAFVVDDLSEGNRAAVDPDRLFELDIRDTDALAAWLRDLRVDSVIHFAALVSVPNSLSEPDDYWSVNLHGTHSLLRAMKEAGVGKLVFSSTAAVYQHGQSRPFRETDKVLPETPYGASKLAAEFLIRDMARNYGMTAVALRYFNACGAEFDGTHGEARREETHVVPVLMEVALGKREQFNLFGTDFDTSDGSCIRDFVSVQDLAGAHLLGLSATLSEPFTAFNLGSGEGTSVLELLDRARSITGRPIPHRAAPRRPGDPAVLVADISSARQHLGWQPQSSDIETILKTAWTWHRSHPEGYSG